MRKYRDEVLIVLCLRNDVLYLMWSIQNMNKWRNIMRMWKEGINKWWNSSWENSLNELKEKNWLKLYVENEVINEWKFWCKPQLNKKILRASNLGT
jgi:hypothetical protein